MDGHYSRFAVIATTEQKSMDFSEPEHGPKLQDHFPRPQIEEKNGRVALRRSFSSSSRRFVGGDSSATLQAAVKRAFSMRRSSSVREGYSRIHDETGEEEEEEGDGGFTEQQQRQGSNHSEQRKKKKKQRPGKFLRTCKRIFGF
ncbi:uncharacterized protein LOC122050879 [Zingiber officinale]|uniref:uncharacterized protein LOC122050879 n=1 Tax=Zingiber officinale TaxID=94328 RepID=UPI001C4A8699|nr:uncharacterized protein LOC122050879 [Zingiber officinale]